MRAPMICPTDHDDACRLAPMITRASPAMMQFLLPSGMPITVTSIDMTAAASVYEEAIMGITYVPVGLPMASRNGFVVWTPPRMPASYP